MGLNDTYSQARSQILLMTQLPTVNVAYSMVLSDENQKSVAQSVNGAGLLGANPNVNDAIAMYILSLAIKVEATRKEKEVNVSNYNPNAICDHCRMKRHYKVDYYRFVGCPPGHPKHGTQRENAESRNNYDQRFKQMRVGPSANNAMMENWNSQSQAMVHASYGDYLQQGQLNMSNMQYEQASQSM